MTANAQRWQRILKVRAVQRQLAELQLHRCEKEVRNLVDLGHRISAIRAAAQPLVGAQNGMMLRSVCELSSRLDTAQRALATPSRNAQEARNRQQHAVVAARQKIVEGAVGMVELAMEQIHAKRLADFSPEQKAQMVTNLLVVLVSERGAQPVVSTGQ